MKRIVSHKSRNVIVICCAIVLTMAYFAFAYHKSRLDADLIAAIKFLDARRVNELLDEGADPNAFDTSQSTSIPISAMIARLFGKNKAQSEGPTALMVVFSPDHVTDSSGLHIAPEPIAIVKALLSKGANPNIVRHSGWDSQPVITHATAVGYLQCVQSLLRYHANPNLRGAQGTTSLMFAPNAPIAELLIRNGADVNLTDDSGHSALWFAKHLWSANQPPGVNSALIKVLRSSKGPLPQAGKGIGPL
jgi:ankyrin repeat protein